MAKKMTIKENPEYFAKLDFMYEVMRDRLEYTNKTIEGFGNKINYLLTFAGVAFVFYLPLISNVLYCTHPLLISLRYLGVFGLVGVLGSLFMAAKVRTFFDAPDPEYIYSQKTFNQEYWEMKSTVISAIKNRASLYPLKENHLASVQA